MLLTFDLVVVSLWHSCVGLVATGWADTLVSTGSSTQGSSKQGSSTQGINSSQTQTLSTRTTRHRLHEALPTLQWDGSCFGLKVFWCALYCRLFQATTSGVLTCSRCGRVCPAPFRGVAHGTAERACTSTNTNAHVSGRQLNDTPCSDGQGKQACKLAAWQAGQSLTGLCPQLRQPGVGCSCKHTVPGPQQPVMVGV